ncbi:type 1 fimbrial protein [Enterobacteriaceae bacterium 4M9]|nr:type 1 fimbrial protein [Enterobacteriaceae bacterium 4M9]
MMIRAFLYCQATTLLKVSLAGMAFYTSAAMADTKVEFSGTLVADPCLVETDSQEQTVELRAIPARTFMDEIQSAPETFHIQLKECDLSLGSQVSVTFSGEKDSVDPSLFEVHGSARGIALAIEDSDGRAVAPDDEQHPVSLSQDDTTLTWRVRTQSTSGGNVGEGEFSAVVIFSLRYE